MGYRRTYGVITTVIVASLVLAGCGESKLVQCDRLNQVTNRMANRVQKFSQTPTKNYTTELANLATELEATAIELRDLRFGDSRIRSLQDQFVQMYTDTSQASRSLLAAAEKRDTAAGASALQSLKAATSRETQLVTQANQYCCPTVDASNRCVNR